MNKLKGSRGIVLLFIDIILINISYISALYLRFSKDIPSRHVMEYRHSFIIITLIYIIVLYLFKLYKSLWNYASIDEFLMAIGGCLTGSVLSLLFGVVHKSRLPFTVYGLATILSVMLIVGFRISFRVYRNMLAGISNGNKAEFNKVLVIGAGYAGNSIIKEMKFHKEMNYNPVVIIDDDITKVAHTISGLKIYGDRTKIVEAVNEYNIDIIVIAIPSASNSCREEIINICKQTKCKMKIVPSVYDLLDRRSPLRKMRDVEVEDLLGREPINLDMNGISDYLTGKVVMVTGGGGSIGSELSRQIAGFKPSELIILDVYENNAYDLQNELKFKFPELKLTVLIASVRDKIRMDKIFEKYKPEVIFHAAAHKHVPLMEENPIEAIKNNVFGTLNTVECAHKYGVERFVLISTDKAVNPTNVMGATKRICEMIIQSIDKISNTEFVAVRFGNVLGSNGSVIPLFKKQIAMGGPITLTHKEITRFFMTIPEAAQLVLQAGAYAIGGEIFILDMGKPVKIYDLANDLIRLSGLDPNIDIEIKYIGLRPGEKLYEEVLMDEERTRKTAHKKIFIGQPMDLNFKTLKSELNEMDKIIDKASNQILISRLEKLVPTYKPENNEQNSKEYEDEEISGITQLAEIM